MKFNWEKLDNNAVITHMDHNDFTYEVKVGKNDQGFYIICGRYTRRKPYNLLFSTSYSFVNMKEDSIIKEAETKACKVMKLSYEECKSEVTLKDILNPKEWKKTKFKAAVEETARE